MYNVEDFDDDMDVGDSGAATSDARKIGLSDYQKIPSRRDEQGISLTSLIS